MCFDKGNQSDQYLQVTYHIFSDQICFLTEKIQKIELNFVLWQVKSNKFMVPPNELSKRALHMRYTIKISKWSIKIKTRLKSFWSLVGSLLGFSWARSLLYYSALSWLLREVYAFWFWLNMIWAAWKMGYHYWVPFTCNFLANIF